MRPEAILGVDPGVACTGLAIVGGRAPSMGAVRGSLKTLEGTIWRVGEAVKAMEFDHLAVEVPQVYYRRDERDPNDLIPVALIAGACIRAAQEKGRPFSWHLPRQWKGTMDGDVFAARILVSLPPAHRAELERLHLPKKLQHNVLDAYALALWAREREAARAALADRMAIDAARP